MIGAVGKRSWRTNHIVYRAKTSWNDHQLIPVLPVRIVQLTPLSEMIHSKGDTPATVGQLMDHSCRPLKHEWGETVIEERELERVTSLWNLGRPRRT